MKLKISGMNNTTLLKRCGNKSALAELIIPHFPDHKIYIEPFFGAGGLFFNKPAAKYNFMNDLDSDIFNLFMVIKNDWKKLYDEFQTIPIHQDLMRYWKKNKEKDPIWKAIRFLFISNFTYLSKGYNLKFTANNTRKIVSEMIEITFEKTKGVKFLNVDYTEVIKNISFAENLCKKKDALIYLDGPYLETNGNYKHNLSSIKDVENQVDWAINTDIRFAMSEFKSDVILDIAKDRNLNVIGIKERRNLKNVRTEILITNYKEQLTLF